ncbi:MAG: hypothetical protein AAF479_12820, partial [Pseudomonadota bacterium]
TSAATLSSACAKPASPLQGRVVSVEIKVPDDKPVIFDGASANRVATKDGYFYQAILPSSQKPDADELANIRKVEENNSRYRDHLREPDVRARAQSLVLPQLEQALLQQPDNPYFMDRGRSVPVLNSTSGLELKLVLRPEVALISSGSWQQRSIGGNILLGAANALAGSKSGIWFKGSFELRNTETAALVKSGSILSKVRLREDSPLNGVPYPELFARLIWSEIARSP